MSTDQPNIDDDTWSIGRAAERMSYLRISKEPAGGFFVLVQDEIVCSHVTEFEGVDASFSLTRNEAVSLAYGLERRAGWTCAGSRTVMVQRVGRAMALADGEDYMESADEYDRRARAAIHAMREPPIEQIRAADKVVDEPGAMRWWRAVIDEFLK